MDLKMTMMELDSLEFQFDSLLCLKLYFLKIFSHIYGSETRQASRDSQTRTTHKEDNRQSVLGPYLFCFLPWPDLPIAMILIHIL
jgi:hypothetical protein